MERFAPVLLMHIKVNDRNCWLYQANMTIGELYLVQHEVAGELNIVDDYIGWNKQRAEGAFHRMATRMLRDKE